MRHLIGLLSLAAALMASGATVAQTALLTTPNRYVNPFVGTARSQGNTNPGATTPFGMTQLSPVTTSTTGGGYTSEDRKIWGFTLTRISGIPCPAVGVGEVMPSLTAHVGPARFRHADEIAEPGYYGVKLGSGIEAEMTATTRTGDFRFTFPTRHGYLRIVGGHVHGHAVRGTTAIPGICSSYSGFTAHFLYEFQQPFTHHGDVLEFDAKRVIVKGAVSYVDDRGAAANLSAENSGWGFDAMRARAADLWTTHLEELAVTGGGSEPLHVFYTALYHSLLAPNTFSDSDGRYVDGNGRIRTADGYIRYTNISTWDSYRTQFPLLCLIEPDIARDIVMSLLGAYQEVGHLPRWQYYGVDTGLMVGDGSDAMIADAVAYGVDVPIDQALAAMVAGATKPGPWARVVERPGLDLYMQYGYVPYDHGEGYIWGSASTSEEYYIDDFAISRVAVAAGKPKLAARFAARAGNWRTVIDPATGQAEPRLRNGSFIDHGTTGEWVDGYTESDEATYQWLVPFDLKGLIQAMGGRSVAAPRLASYFSAVVSAPDQAYSSHLEMGNEPGFATPWTYLWLGRPGQAAATIARIQQVFTDTAGGLPGDDDLGATSSWYVWSALGLYPVIPGVAGFAVTPSAFSRVSIEGATPWTFTGRAANSAWVSLITRKGGALPSFDAPGTA